MLNSATLPTQVMNAHIEDEDMKEFLTQEVHKDEFVEVKLKGWPTAETQVCLCAVGVLCNHDKHELECPKNVLVGI